MRVEIKGYELPKGSLVRLFSENNLKANWSDAAVEAIQRSLKLGGWQKIDNFEIRATRTRGGAGWKRM